MINKLWAGDDGVYLPCSQVLYVSSTTPISWAKLTCVILYCPTLIALISDLQITIICLLNLLEIYWPKSLAINSFIKLQIFFSYSLGIGKPSWTEIRRHIFVFGKASPDNPELQSYWQKRQTNNKKYLFKIRQIIWRKQEGKCTVCLDNIDNGEAVHLHHKLPRKNKGTDHINNLALLHMNCHMQVHSKQGQQIANVSKSLEPYAG